MLPTILNTLPVQYNTMLENISANYPAITAATKSFNKSQSQFMDNLMTVSQPTELRSLRQITAEITKSKHAMDSAFFKLQKKKIRIKQKQRELETTSDNLERELIEVQIAELTNQIETTMGYVEGAIRKTNAYVNQYNNILAGIGKKEVNEKDFEEDEERYHIMKAFEQALHSARAHHGVIDEGNHIYFFQIGISGTAAQVEVNQFLSSEGQMITDGTIPDSSNAWQWLHDMARKYAGCAKKLCEFNKKQLIDYDSLHNQ